MKKMMMKNLKFNCQPILLLSLFLLIFTAQGCNQAATQNKYVLTEQEKETAKKEISAQIDTIIRGAKNLDVETAMQPYSNTENFLIINPDATFSGYQKMKSDNSEAFKKMRSLNFTTVNQEFRFLSDSQVLLTWFGKSEVELGSGEKIKYESYVGTMLFSRENGEWKIIYAHETASPPLQETPNKQS